MKARNIIVSGILAVSSVFMMFATGCSLTNNGGNQQAGAAATDTQLDGSPAAEQVTETKTQKEFRLKWLEHSSDELESMSDKELVENYVDLKLFEEEYRTFIYNKISNSEKFYFPDNKVYKDESYIEPNGSVEIFIADAFDRDHLRKYFNTANEESYFMEEVRNQGFLTYEEYLNNIISSAKPNDTDRNNMKAYISNFSVMEDGRPAFKDESMIYECDYLNDKIFPNTEIAEYFFKFDAYNDDFRGRID